MKITLKHLKTLIKEALAPMTDDDAESYISVADHGSENLARYSAVKKRLLSAGFRVKSAAGHGSYGASMLMSDATEAEAVQVLSDAPFFNELFISAARGEQMHYASDRDRAYDTPRGRKIWHNAYDSVPHDDDFDDSKNRAVADAAFRARKAASAKR